jgi:biopolymer transport protein ExbD
MHIREDEPQDQEFQIAPMVDVVFMLIIFFMLSAAVTSRELELGMTLPGPRPGPFENIPPPPIELAIREDGTVLFNELEVGRPGDTKLAGLETRLRRAVELFGQRQPVIIEPAPSALHGRVVEVVDCCATAQVKALAFAR